MVKGDRIELLQHELQTSLLRSLKMHSWHVEAGGVGGVRG